MFQDAAQGDQPADFEWSNKQLVQRRVRYCAPAATFSKIPEWLPPACPARMLAILALLRDKIPAEVFTQAFETGHGHRWQWHDPALQQRRAYQLLQ
jgi:hypothetical protein